MLGSRGQPDVLPQTNEYRLVNVVSLESHCSSCKELGRKGQQLSQHGVYINPYLLERMLREPFEIALRTRQAQHSHAMPLRQPTPPTTIQRTVHPRTSAFFLLVLPRTVTVSASVSICGVFVQ